MPTISSLMEGKKPGEIRISYPSTYGGFFVPFFKEKDGNWHGLDEDGDAAWYTNTVAAWELHTEPKRKKKVAPYMIKGEAGFHVMTVRFYTNDDEARKAYRDLPDIKVVQRVTALEVEVDE